jgi:hypothetical protein
VYAVVVHSDVYQADERAVTTHRRQEITKERKQAMSKDLQLRRHPYPGKFEGGLVIDEVAYEMTLDSYTTAECWGASTGSGWYGLLEGAVVGQPYADLGDINLTEDELQYLRSVVGAIVHENNEGFVDVTWYDDAKKLITDWTVIEDEHAGKDLEGYC